MSHVVLCDLSQKVQTVDGRIAQVAKHNVNASRPVYLRQGPLAVIRLQNIVDTQMLESLN
ncbi:hypothetical protein ACVNP3_16035 [Pseudomonas chlororaphis subsp. piscium]